MACDEPEPLLTIRSDRLQAGITTFGAALWDLHLGGEDRSLVLGFASVGDYQASRTHAGAVVGRVCNRLGHGQAWLGGRRLQLECNVPPYHLHGGATGFSQQRWTVEAHTRESLTLSLHSADGHEGYPGNLSVSATYTVQDSTLSLDLSATTDAPTLVNLCHHAYFRLSRSDTIGDHVVSVAAGHVLDVDEDLVPTGSVLPVDGTGFDLREGRRFDRAPDPPGMMNHTMLLDGAQAGYLAHAATVEADHRLEVWTTQPALHVYGGQRIAPGTPLRDGTRAGPRAGFCLEAQGWTDAPNHAGFPSIELIPGETYCHTTRYRLA